jgi:hypothetical protein
MLYMTIQGLAREESCVLPLVIHFFLSCICIGDVSNPAVANIYSQKYIEVDIRQVCAHCTRVDVADHP